MDLNRTEAPMAYDATEFEHSLKPYLHYKLDNTTPVYMVNGGSQDVVHIELVFKAGNWQEDKNIVAASTNFLLKNGTHTKSAFEINEHFEFYGAYLNRACYNETATITLHCLSKHLPILLPVMAELVTESNFPENELAIYKQNQLQRLSVNLQKCDFVANRLIDENLYGLQHPYGKYTSTIAYEAVNKNDIEAFYNSYYVNGNCTIFASGKLPTDIEKQLNNVFGKLPFNKKNIVEKQYDILPAAEKKVQIINDENGVQAAIRIARPFPNRQHPNFPKVQVLNTIFGGFFGSRLMSNIREDKGYTYGIHSFLQNHIHHSAWMISTEAGRNVAEATIAEVYKEMELLRNTLIDAEELHLVRNYMLGTLLGDLDGPFQIMARWKTYILNNLNETYFYNAVNTIKNITAPELQELANQYLQPNHFYELVVI